MSLKKVIGRDGKEYTQDSIKLRLSMDERFVLRALHLMFLRQTQDERVSQSTQHVNKRGFNVTDAKVLTDLATVYLSRKHLTHSQIQLAGRKLKKYSRQLLEIIHENASK